MSQHHHSLTSSRRQQFRAWALSVGCILLTIAALGAAKKKPAAPADAAPPGEVTLVWCSAGTADVYLNGKPLHEVKPDFTSRTDEPGYEHSVHTPLKVGDVLTVGVKRRGEGRGFRLAAFDSQNRLVWQTETSNWHAFSFRDARAAQRWYLPATAAKATQQTLVVPDKGIAMNQFEKPRTEVADTLWAGDGDVALFFSKITERRNYARLPLMPMAKAGKVMYFANGAQLDGLRPDDLDGSNRVKGFKHPLHYTLQFSEPTEVHGALVCLTHHKGTFHWQIECGASRKDLAEKQGSYQRVTPQQTSRADQAVDLFWKPQKATVWQLTASKDAGEGGISLRKFELLVPAK